MRRNGCMGNVNTKYKKTMQSDGDMEITKQNTTIEGEATEIRNIQKQIQTNSAKQRSHGEHKKT